MSLQSLNTSDLCRVRWLRRLAWVALLCVTAAPGMAQTLGQALDNTNLTWSTSGTGGGGGWFVTGKTPQVGTNDATSGGLPSTSSPVSTLQTTLVGPGTLTFWWRNDSTVCTLAFIAGTNILNTFGNYPSWQYATYYIGAGPQTFKWTYSRYTTGGDFGAAYVDGVNFSQGTTAPLITTQPLSQSQVIGMDATFTVAAGGTPPLTYQWRNNGTDISGATSNSYTVHSIQATNFGNYTVLVTNTVGSIESSNASLELGQVTAWGSPGWNVTTIPPGTSNVLTLHGAYNWNLLRKADGSNAGWGVNAYGQSTVPGDLTNVTAFATGSSHSMALRSDGTVVCWGYNGYHQTNVPPDLSNVVAIAAGDYHCVALKADGTVVAWGDNYYGQTNVPAGLTNVVGIAAATTLTLALTADGKVVEWSGQSAPVGLSNVVAITADTGHYAALRGDGSVLAWGQNIYGETNVPMGLSNVVAISAGAFHTLALRADGTVAAWGISQFGLTNPPPALTNVTAISAGAFHNLALVGNGSPVLNANITDANWSSDGFQLSIPSQCGRVYQLQYKASSADSTWSSLPLVAGTGTNLVLKDPVATDSQRVYRVLRW